MPKISRSSRRRSRAELARLSPPRAAGKARPAWLGIVCYVRERAQALFGGFMSKSSREKILRDATLFGAAVAASTACDRPQYTYSDDVPISGSGTISVAGGSSTIGGGLISI